MAAGKFKLNKSDLKDIENKIHEIEKKTTGEILPVVLKQSDLYPAAHFRISLLLILTIPFIFYFSPLYVDDFLWILAALPVLAVIGYLIGYLDRFKRLFSTSAEMNEEVHQRALQCFFENNVHTTKNRNAILILVSILERKVEILADAGVNQVVERSKWDDVIKLMIRNIKSNNLKSGLIAGIDECAEILIKHFPEENPDDDDQENEIQNTLLLE